MTKIIKAVEPYYYKGKVNFKYKPYDAWKKIGMPVAKAHYPWRPFHRLVFNYSLPAIGVSKTEARLRFVQPYSLSFDTWPDYLIYEIIPFFWDVWPDYFDITCLWLRRYNVRTAIFTSSQMAERIQTQFPEMNVFAVTEGIDVASYHKGKPLTERTIDFLNYGRGIERIVEYDLNNMRGAGGKENIKMGFTQEELFTAIADAKVVAAYPRSWTHPEQAGDIETLTQRYWECMLSRCVMIGHAPQELINLIGYNPVIEIDKDNPQHQLEDVIAHISDYQELVDRNRDAALKYGDWMYSINRVVEFISKIYD